MNKYRKAIETQKMVDRFRAEGMAIQLGYAHWHDYIQFGPDKKDGIKCKDIYSELKRIYFETFLETETEEIELELSEEVIELLQKQADEKDILIDEYMAEVLELYLAEQKDLDEEIKIKEEELIQLKRKKRGHL